MNLSLTHTHTHTIHTQARTHTHLQTLKNKEVLQKYFYFFGEIKAKWSECQEDIKRRLLTEALLAEEEVEEEEAVVVVCGQMRLASNCSKVFVISGIQIEF